ncbi:MAG: hypothetical protein IT286_04930, partial [Proteobacteria bacterium]|nr:hypothetical protein [Pseudomonadota bacterium]
MKRKINLSELTQTQIEEITKKAEQRKNVPLVKSEQLNMRIDPLYLDRLRKLAQKAGEKPTTFGTRLLMEDIDRLWKV